MLYGEGRIPRLIDHAATLDVLVTREELVPFAHEALGVELFDLDRDQTARYPDITSVSVGSDYARSDEVEYDEQIDVERGSDSDQQIDAIDVALGDVRPARSDIPLEMLRNLDFVFRRYDVKRDHENACRLSAGTSAFSSPAAPRSA